ncbi:MAG: hypothetical protein IID36_03270 [Planctomycetes bacterium]|nr:hypothetical protein [Planctomycetota bacterium]
MVAKRIMALGLSAWLACSAAAFAGGNGKLGHTGPKSQTKGGVEGSTSLRFQMKDQQEVVPDGELVGGIGGGFAGGPINDGCADSVPISNGATSFSTIGADEDGPVLPAECDEDFGVDLRADIWFDYDASCTGTLTVSTCGAATYDTRLALYSACTCPATNDDFHACNDDGPGCPDFTSILVAEVEQGTCYKLRVGGWGDPDFPDDPGAQGTGTLTVTCEPSGPGPCLGEILSVEPADGTEDARQPHVPGPGADEDPADRQGIGSADEPIIMTLDVAGEPDSCFFLCETAPDAVLGENGVASVTETGNGVYEIVLNHAIAPGSVTTISYGNQFVEFLSHPANTNHDGFSNANDILHTIDMLNGVVEPEFGEFSTDVDHSGLFGTSDVLRVIDLLNGAIPYAIWLGAARPVNDGDCPGEVQDPCGDGVCDEPIPPTSDCCIANGTPGCDDPECEAAVCACDAFCCDNQWDNLCATNGENDNGCGAGVLCEELCTVGGGDEDCLSCPADCECPDDSCTEAVDIFDGDTDFSTIGATTDGPELPIECDKNFGLVLGADIWFEYVATCSGVMTTSTCDQADYDTRLAIYELCECPVSNDLLVGCNDDGEGCADFSSFMEANVVEGTCYKLRVGGWAPEGGAGATGSGTLSISCVNPFPICDDAEGECTEANGTPGCNDPACCVVVCTIDPFCCNAMWDGSCADHAIEECD